MVFCADWVCLNSFAFGEFKWYHYMDYGFDSAFMYEVHILSHFIWKQFQSPAIWTLSFIAVQKFICRCHSLIFVCNSEIILYTILWEVYGNSIERTLIVKWFSPTFAFMILFNKIICLHTRPFTPFYIMNNEHLFSHHCWTHNATTLPFLHLLL